MSSPTLVQFGQLPFEKPILIFGQPLKSNEKNLFHHQRVIRTVPDCVKIWQIGVVYYKTPETGILIVGQCAKVVRFLTHARHFSRYCFEMK